MQEVVRKLPTSTMTLQMGPSHPASHGTSKFTVELDGETILAIDIEFGYLHRGFEKMCENVTWTQVVPYTDRLNYVSPLINNVGFYMAVEKIAEVKVPERALYIRTIISEMSRICDHLTCVAATAMELGGLSIFFYMIKARDRIWDLIEDITGARLTVSYVRIGGVMNDLPLDFAEKWKPVRSLVLAMLHDVDVMLTKNRIFIDRMRNTGIINGETAMAYGLTGPMLRGSGVKFDIRKASPYLVYDRVEFDVPVGAKGDNFDRYVVRMQEIKYAVSIIDQCLAQIPDGPFITDDPRLALPDKGSVYGSIEGTVDHFMHIMFGIQVPKGEAYSYVEGGNGELGFYVVSDGKGKPYRVRVRPPCFANLSALPTMITGALLADLVPTFDSINMIGGEIDR
ncbi:MAG: NADH-quinone oxidoreductase subunit 4 [Myxococcota bacterium]|nr:NADH-quinone oxidoreductase subunit 4 [Myxococcota bacterium]